MGFDSRSFPRHELHELTRPRMTRRGVDLLATKKPSAAEPQPRSQTANGRIKGAEGYCAGALVRASGAIFKNALVALSLTA